jgi:Zn-finger nucleic acid-binding protein
MQYDVTALATGEKLRCSCGELITVPDARSHEAAVVRCSSCGAPRGKDVSTCSFCDSSFSLHERDLHTICPGCMARISDRASYCHSCGTAIAPQLGAGGRTDLDCPACGAGSKLRSRLLDERGLTVLECGACAGMWLGADLFARLASDANEVRVAVEALGAGGLEAVDLPLQRIDPSHRLYRPCPTCGSLMHRRNYGRKSGVIVDTCRDHGVWFDHGELAQILRWLRSGGARRANLEADLERREIARHEALFGPRAEPPELAREPRTMADLLRPVIDFLAYFV